MIGVSVGDDCGDIPFPVIWHIGGGASVPGENQGSALICVISSGRMQDAGIAQYQRAGRDGYVDLIRVIAEHDGMGFFYKSGALFVCWYQLIVERDALEVGAGDDFQTAVFHCGIG